jgi:hypothetical protein
MINEPAIRRTGFSREIGISAEGNLANAPTSSRLKPVLRDCAEPVGARLARDKGNAVWQQDRVIVLREQARLPQTIIQYVGARLARELGDAICLTHRVIVHREQARSYR